MHSLNRPVFGAIAFALLTLLASATPQFQGPNGVVTLAAGTGATLAAVRESDTLVNQVWSYNDLTTQQPVLPCA